MKKKHYSAILKERIAELEADIYKILDGDLVTEIRYRTVRSMNQDFEKVVWFGNSSLKNQPTK
jgi:hypothetical protein